MINFDEILSEFDGHEEKNLNLLEIGGGIDSNTNGNDRRNMIAFEDQE